MSRYLLNFSFIGTYFRGASRQIFENADLRTVQGSIEEALKPLNSNILPEIVLSSRTDSGVHALNSTAHVDLKKLPTKVITTHLNQYFSRNSLSIIAQQTRRVPPEFHARFSAISRTYIYRLAVIKPDVLIDDGPKSLIPIEELDRCDFFFDPSFDVEKFKKAAVLFEGYHDFETFKKIARTSYNEKLHYRRFLHYIEVSNGTSSIAFPNQQKFNAFNYFNIKVKGRSFVHNQIRRIIGVLKSAAVSKLTCSDIRTMLQVPSHKSWNNKASVAPARGLYLCDVEYNPEDLIMPVTQE